jgi:hypothetical protein
MDAGGPPGHGPTIYGFKSADLGEDPVKYGGERLRIALLAEPAVVAREDHRLGPESLRHGQRRAVWERAL